MKTFMYFLIATAVFSPATAFPQGLVPTLDSEYEFCQDRPTEPEWMQNLHVRESYKRLLIQSIYRLKSYQRAAEVDDCTCGTLFPQWTDAVQHFNDNYLHLERFESLQVRRDFHTQSNVLRQSVKELCVAEGNW